MSEETKKVKELESIAITPFPEWNGPRIPSDKRISDTHKLSIGLPVVEEAEDFAEMYPNISNSKSQSTGLQAAVELGLIQWLYGETFIVKMVKEMLEADPNPDNLDLDKITEMAQEACQRDSGRKPGKSAEVKREAARAKKQDAEAQALGYASIEEAIAALKAKM